MNSVTHKASALAAAFCIAAASNCMAAADGIRPVSDLAATGMRGSVKMVLMDTYVAEDMAMDGSVNNLELSLETRDKKIFDRNGYVTYDSTYTDGHSFLSLKEYDGINIERYCKYVIDCSTEEENIIEEKIYTYDAQGRTAKFVLNTFVMGEDGKSVSSTATEYLHFYTGDLIDSVRVTAPDGSKTYVIRRLDDNGSYEYLTTNASGSFEYDEGIRESARYDARQRLVYGGSADLSDEYTYDDRGDVIASTSGSGDDRESFAMKYTAYDAQGNWTKGYMFAITPEGEKICINMFERKIEYWD